MSEASNVTEQLLAFRKKLEQMFKDLRIVLDVSICAYTLAAALPFEGNPELSTLIRYHIMLDIDQQMRAVSRMVEALGGKTEYTEEQTSAPAS